MRKGKPKEQDFEPPAKPGYVKRYFIDPDQVELFAPADSTRYHVALGAKEALKAKLAAKDVRVRLRRKHNQFELVVKVPKEIKVREPETLPQTQTEAMAPVAS